MLSKAQRLYLDSKLKKAAQNKQNVSGECSRKEGQSLISFTLKCRKSRHTGSCDTQTLQLSKVYTTRWLRAPNRIRLRIAVSPIILLLLPTALSFHVTNGSGIAFYYSANKKNCGNNKRNKKVRKLSVRGHAFREQHRSANKPRANS